MPWCPKCKTEYRNDITVCSDCKVELIENLSEEDEMVPLIQTQDIKIADKLVRYFDYSGVKSMSHFDEENEVYVISVPNGLEKKAKKLYQAFYIVEREQLVKEDPDNDISTENDETADSQTDIADVEAELEADTSESEDTNEEQVAWEDDSDDFNPSSEPAAYVMKADEYKDLHGSVWIFLIFGFVGLIVVILNGVGILNFFHGIIPTIVMGGLFLFFVYVGITSQIKAKKVQTEIEAENKLTTKINQWLKNNLTESFLSSIHNNNISDELNFLKMTEIIKKMLLKEFEVKSIAYLDQLIEDFYSSTFEGKEDN